MRTGGTGLTRGFGAIAVIGAAVAPSGCSTTKAIWPGDLPIVIAAAENRSDAKVVVRGPDGDPVKLQGRLDTVVVTRSRRGMAKDRYDAPLSARIDGVRMVVADQEQQHRYALDDIKSVEVQRYNTTLAILTGTGLLALGAIAIVLGAVGVGSYIRETERNQVFAITFGFPLVTGGIGLAAGGLPLILAGSRDPWASRPKVTKGPGGLKILF